MQRVARKSAYARLIRHSAEAGGVASLTRLVAEALKIPRAMVDEIVAHSREEAPNECCGVLTGANGTVTVLDRTENPFASPVRFEINPEDLYRSWKAAEERGEDIVGFYHSHVEAPAYPSQTDINWAENWPHVVHVICSLGGNEPVVRGFSITGGEVDEVELVHAGD
jgi:proteasome lid subunit RPN8/RPN11